eukprot:CAMPEP_0206621204 /NCGR_PEP_ID=MMETSP0325_2-20121206/62084_1 /ASSEMBLY_ACC=CAM_ASM_000347 /TAXON_ID=2866 /ORGANISM="Crypthecodinium cohnii, Strain Seligo" /LENGTH=83 /DNA_ID=CAMNT_0054144319 /DNA_START=517 /DNA_END=769 /DNA_ORIENTATION=-
MCSSSGQQTQAGPDSPIDDGVPDHCGLAPIGDVDALKIFMTFDMNYSPICIFHDLDEVVVDQLVDGLTDVEGVPERELTYEGL